MTAKQRHWKMREEVRRFKETGELTPFLEKHLKGNTALLFELYPGLAPTPLSNPYRYHYLHISSKLEQFHNLQKVYFNPKIVEQFNKQSAFYKWFNERP